MLAEIKEIDCGRMIYKEAADLLFDWLKANGSRVILHKG